MFSPESRRPAARLEPVESLQGVVDVPEVVEAAGIAVPPVSFEYLEPELKTVL
jgi:hypothetical protein